MADILIIDDDEQMRQVMGRLLRKSGHTVREAANGKIGLALFRDYQPAMVITDLLMPDQEGIETIRLLHNEAPGTPILAISGSMEPAFLRAATALGATAGLAKPFRSDEFSATISRLLAAVE